MLISKQSVIVPEQELLRDYMKRYRQTAGRELQRRRMLFGWKQQQLAQLSGVGQATISYAEAGLRIPKLEYRMMICGALGCEHDDIWPAPPRAEFARSVQQVAA
jgi:transcriptional regulator with XRE-family HTH domain